MSGLLFYGYDYYLLTYAYLYLFSLDLSKKLILFFWLYKENS